MLSVKSPRRRCLHHYLRHVCALKTAGASSLFLGIIGIALIWMNGKWLVDFRTVPLCVLKLLKCPYLKHLEIKSVCFSFVILKGRQHLFKDRMLEWRLVQFPYDFLLIWDLCFQHRDIRAPWIKSRHKGSVPCKKPVRNGNWALVFPLHSWFTGRCLCVSFSLCLVSDKKSAFEHYAIKGCLGFFIAPANL